MLVLSPGLGRVVADSLLLTGFQGTKGSSTRGLLVDLLAALEHGEEFVEAAGAGLGLFGLGEAVGDRVAVGAVEVGEEGRGGGVGVELALEVVGDLGGALALVGGLPAAVGLRRGDLGGAGGTEGAGASRASAFSRLIFDQRPRGTAGREALQEVGLVEAALLAVDPAEAEGQLEGLGVGDARLRRALLGDLQPEARRVSRRSPPATPRGPPARRTTGSPSSSATELVEGNCRRNSTHNRRTHGCDPRRGKAPLRKQRLRPRRRR